MNKMRISLSQRGDEIKGKIESEGSGLFVLEALALVVESLAKNAGIQPDEMIRDLYSVVCDRVRV